MNSNDYYMPLYLALTPKEVRHHYDEQLPLRALELVLRPLLYNSLHAYVYGLTKDSALYIDNSEILIAGKGKFRLDAAQECIKGHVYLWNVRGEKGVRL